MSRRNYNGPHLRGAGQRPNLQRAVAAQEPIERPLRRFRPRHGAMLTMAAILGPWRPSGAVAGAGVFALVWSTRTTDYWAALHDFAPSDQLRLIEECAWLDRVAGGQHHAEGDH